MSSAVFFGTTRWHAPPPFCKFPRARGWAYPPPRNRWQGTSLAADGYNSTRPPSFRRGTTWRSGRRILRGCARLLFISHEGTSSRADSDSGFARSSGLAANQCRIFAMKMRHQTPRSLLARLCHSSPPPFFL
ncbi:MAG: hypothetical protein CEN88_378 [Candidatus Berkelbacteria bacterium Licking1014_2]|uniref:Uncharacterized protein n=1 Tax=Candidatus Berkelbacteria bacterium Licking1014_2 TaxID=2017146 RepID=A0A554LTN4_9BACT|nr:MAG: hypothetical protein CEN88_378 [Candidatus Berkelbacteria bacterium Licking1014_2]